MIDENDESVLPKERLASLCDGIFAITMTLMVLDLKAPGNIPKDLANEELPGALYNLLPSIEAYMVSFAVLSTFWIRHQIQFNLFYSVDRVIIIINILFLLFIGVVPFTVGLKEDYPQSQFAFLIYLTNLFLITTMLTIQWEHAIKHKTIIKDEINKVVKRRILMLSKLPIALFLISFILSFFHLRWAFYVIYLIPILYALSRKIIKD